MKKVRLTNVEISQGELFNVITLIRFCFRSDSVQVTDAFMKVLGRLIAQENSDPVKSNNFNLSIRKTFIEEISANIRKTLSLSSHHLFFKPLFRELLLEESLISDRAVALLHLLSSNEYDGARIGQIVELEKGLPMGRGIILNFVGDEATIFMTARDTFHRSRIVSLKGTVL